MDRTIYRKRWVEKSSASVETVEYAAYTRRAADGKREEVPAAKRLTYFAEDGNAYTAAGVSETKIVFFIPEVVEEDETE